MSAFVVEDKVINRVVTVLAKDKNLDYARKVILDETGLNITNPSEAAKLGEMMFSLNCNAVEQRYGDGEAAKFRSLDYSCRLEPSTTIQAYKSLRCWRYQCSEGDIPEASLLYTTMERVLGEMAQAIVDALPTYDKAEW
jgi:hypothetical protein